MGQEAGKLSLADIWLAIWPILCTSKGTQTIRTLCVLSKLRQAQISRALEFALLEGWVVKTVSVTGRKPPRFKLNKAPMGGRRS